MVPAAFTAAAIADLWTAITAIIHYNYLLNLKPGAGAVAATTTSAQASASAGDFQNFLTFAAAGGLYTAVALIYRRLLRQAEGAAAAAGAGNQRHLSDLVAFVFAAAGLLELLLFVPCGGGGAVDVVGAIGLAAFRALPAAATGTFFLGMTLIIVALAHVRAGAEGGGGALAGDNGQIQPIQGLVPLLTKMAFGAAAGLIFLMSVALYADVGKY